MEEELQGIVVSHKPIREANLKRLLLIFDKLYFIHPDENNFLIPDNIAKIKLKNMELQMGKYAVLYNGENYKKAEDELLNKCDYAVNKGVVRILDLNIRKFYEKNWLPLRLAYDFDTGNAELLNNFLPLISRTENISKESGLIRGGFIEPLNRKLYPEIPPQISFHNKDDNELFRLDHQLLSIAGKLNRTLAVCHEFKLIPIFINENLARAYALKINIAKSNKESKLNNEFIKTHSTPLENVQFLLHKISEIILPDAIVDQLTMKEIMYARNSTFNECIKLRRKLIKAVKFLSETEFNENFIDEINLYIKYDVEPSINEYQKKFRSCLNKFIKYTLPPSLTVAGSVIGIQQNLSPQAIAYLSGASGVIGTFASELSQYILRRRANKLNNTFSYFINLRD